MPPGAIFRANSRFARATRGSEAEAGCSGNISGGVAEAHPLIKANFESLTSYFRDSAVHSLSQSILDLFRGFQAFNVCSNIDTASIVQQSFCFILSFEEAELSEVELLGICGR